MNEDDGLPLPLVHVVHSTPVDLHVSRFKRVFGLIQPLRLRAFACDTHRTVFSLANLPISLEEYKNQITTKCPVFQS